MPVLGLCRYLSDDGGPKRVIFRGLRFVIIRLGAVPPAYLGLVDADDDGRGTAREPAPAALKFAMVSTP